MLDWSDKNAAWRGVHSTRSSRTWTRGSEGDWPKDKRPRWECPRSIAESAKSAVSVHEKLHDKINLIKLCTKFYSYFTHQFSVITNHLLVYKYVWEHQSLTITYQLHVYCDTHDFVSRYLIGAKMIYVPQNHQIAICSLFSSNIYRCIQTFTH